jgi:lysozyme family protein
MVSKERAFDTLAKHILKWEGLLFVSPSEPGGMAYKGITYATYNALCKQLLGRDPSEAHFKSLSNNEAKVFIKHYWDSVGANKVESSSIAAWITEMAWGSGVVRSVKTVQQTLNYSFGKSLAVDGVMGTKTLAAINSTDESKLFDALGVARIKFLKDLAVAKPDKAQYLDGWLRRVNEFLQKKSIFGLTGKQVVVNSSIGLAVGIGLLAALFLGNNNKNE